MERVDALRDFWIEHRWTDLFVATVVVGAHGIVVWQMGRFDVLSWLTPGDRRGLYGSFAVVVSLTGALSGVAVGQLGSAKGPRAKALKQHGGRALAASWRSIYVGAMGAALLALAALGLDGAVPRPNGHNAAVAMWAFEFGVVIGVIKFARLTALFEPMLMAFVRDDVEPEEPLLASAPTIDPLAFERRAAG